MFKTNFTKIRDLPPPREIAKYLPVFVMVAALLFFFMAMLEYVGHHPLIDKVSSLKIENDNLKAEILALEIDLDQLSRLPQNAQEEKQKYFQYAKLLEDEVLAGQSPYRIAYLTFDDGPYALTYEYLRILREHNVLASFFVLGKPDYLEVYKATLAEGHTLGNHSYSHLIRKGLYKSPASFIKDVLKQDAFLRENFDYQASVFRFPGGSGSAGKMKAQCVDLLHEHGYGYVDWNALTRDAEVRGLSMEQAYNNVMTRALTKNFAVLLMHDFNSASLAALPTIIEQLQENNYVLLPLFRESHVVL